ncbi:MAG: hypothetical protein OXB98_07420 [Bryobacterales bacterium]|nr:hypothetical protein [Bryobacterales bacterium]
MTTRTAIVFVLLAGVFAAAGEVPAPPPIAPEAAGGANPWERGHPARFSG